MSVYETSWPECCTPPKNKKKKGITRHTLKSKKSTCTSFLEKEKKNQRKKGSVFVQCHLQGMGPPWGNSGGVMHACTVYVKWVDYCTDLTVRQQIVSQEPDSPVEQPRPKSRHCPQQFLSSSSSFSSRSWPELALLKKWYYVYIST